MADCSSNSCVGVKVLSTGGVRVWQTTDPDGPWLLFTPGEWAAFAAGVKAGDFDHIGEEASI
jgi:Domain of unknown function (DUF397)